MFNIDFNIHAGISFGPKTSMQQQQKKYTKKLKVQFMVQARQFRKTHVDCHYASALYRYERKFCVKFREYTTFLSQDDKHTIKVGGPGYPVAAVDRGRAVLVGLNEKMMVGDHDFTKFTLTPSVNFLIDIPETIEGLFYSGKVFVGLKDSTFEHSSPIRHATELKQILENRYTSIQPLLVLYMDGGRWSRSSSNVCISSTVTACFVHSIEFGFFCVLLELLPTTVGRILLRGSCQS